MDTEVKNRAWVKDAAIIFLAILLVLTFFSQTILNRSLTEVATQEVKQGTITAKVRGKGIVEALGNNNVKAPGSVTISKVMVRTGDEVKAGDVLFVLGPGDSAELEAAREVLIELQNSYDLALANIPVGSNYLPQQNEIAKLAKNVSEAKSAMNEIANALKLVGEDEESVTLSQQEILRLKSEMDKTIKEADRLRAKRDELQSRIDVALNDLNVAEERVSQLTALIEAETDEEKKAALQVELSKAEALRNEKSAALAAVKASVQSELELAIVEVNSLEIKLAALIDTLNSLEGAKQSTVVGVTNKYTYEDYLAAKRAYEDAAADYQSAVSNLEYQYNMDSRSQYTSSLSAQSIAAKIERQKEKIRELSGEDEESNAITAKTGGTVTEINCTSGDSVVKDDILAVIEVPEMGYTLSFSVTNDQARRLKVGDEATISNFYWGSSIKAKLKSIATDKKNPQTQKTLTFDIEGDVSAGSELTLSVGQKSSNYDLVIPNSAIKNDNNGSFVYTIYAKNSPLGNRYIAKRVKVEVIASDDTNSAVNAELNNGDFVITTTAAPIKNGDQVRLADNMA